MRTPYLIREHKLNAIYMRIYFEDIMRVYNYTAVDILQYISYLIKDEHYLLYMGKE